MSSYNEIAGRRTQRIETLTDAVFAIVMTLLVLELRMPVRETIHSEFDLWESFLHLKSELMTYFLSFMTLGLFWNGHTTQYEYIRRSDRNLFWMNIFFLMIVSLLPFTTSFLARHIEFRFAVGLYWLNIFLLGMLGYGHWKYVLRHQYIEPDISIVYINKAICHRIIVGQSLYAFGALLCLISTYLSILFIIVVQLNYALAIFEKRSNLAKREINIDRSPTERRSRRSISNL